MNSARKLVVAFYCLYFINLMGFCQDNFSDEGQIYLEKARSFTQTFIYDSAIYYARLGKETYEGSPHWDKYLEMVQLEADMIMRTELKLDEATHIVQSHLPLAKQHLGPTHYVVAKFYHTLGNLQWYRTDFIQAIRYFEMVLPIYQNTEDNTYRVSAILLNIGTCNFHIGEFDTALEYYQKALETNVNAGNTEAPIMGSIFNSLGISHADRGDFDMALEYYRKSLRIKLKYHPTVSREAAESYHNMAIVYKNKGEYERSFQLTRKARSIELAIKGPEHPRVGDSYFNEANTNETIGNSRRALELMDSTQSIYLKAFPPTHLKIADMYGRMATMNLSLNNFGQAEQLAAKALDIRKQNLGARRHPHLGGDFARIAMIAEKKGELKTALDYYQRALIGNSKSFDNSELGQSPEWSDVMRASDAIRYLAANGKILIRIAEDAEQEADKIKSMELAYQILLKASDFIENHRTTLRTESSKIYLHDKYRSVYDQGIRLCYDMLSLTQDPVWGENAFQFAEKSKSMVLYEAIRNLGAKRFAGIPDEALELESRLKKELLYYKEKTVSLPSKELIQDSTQLFWIDKRFSLKQSYDSLLAVFEQEYPDYYKLKYSSSVSTIADIQQQLPEETIMLSYHKTDTTVFVFALSSGKFDIHKYDGSYFAEDSIRHYYFAISGRNDAFSTTDNYSFSLYKQLIQRPLEDFSQAKKLILVPDGALGYVPFDLLLTELPPDSEIPDYRRFPWLIRKYRTSYAYSASLLMENIHQQPEPFQEYLGFAPIYDQYDSPLALADNASANSVYRDRDWITDLPGAREEVSFARNLFDGTAMLAEKATEGNFKKMVKRPAILHLAMHARVEDDNLAHSELLFTPNPQSQEDGILKLSEIYTMEINSQLAVLSACNTGYGAIRRGEGIMSLSRAFMYAGCPSILTSLWWAKDQAASDIMGNFYEQIQAGKSREEALHLAKINYLNQADMLMAHPRNWAGFILIGDPGPIQFGTAWGTYWWLAGLVVLAIVGGFIYSKKRKLSPVD